VPVIADDVGVDPDGTAPVGDAVGNDSLPEVVDESVGLAIGEAVGDVTTTVAVPVIEEPVADKEVVPAGADVGLTSFPLVKEESVGLAMGDVGDSKPVT